MKIIDKQDIEDIAAGAAVLGTGGGGDPHIGRLMALQAIEDYGPIQVISAEDLAEDDLVVPSAMMGAPTVLLEKAPNGREAYESFKMIENYMGQKIKATMPIEAGGVNSMIPLALAAQLQLPVVDIDGMGRAFPELQMTTFYLNGVSATPAVLSDEKGNASLLNTIDNVWTERIARSATVEMGGSVMMSIYPMTGRQIKPNGIRDVLKLEKKIGQSLREAPSDNRDPVAEVLSLTSGYELFKGKVVDVDRKTDAGFAKGTATIEGIDRYKNETLRLDFQNEMLVARRDGRVICSTPDLICALDVETGQPYTTESLKYGTRCYVVGLPCHSQWRTEKGIAACGPRYFGYATDYIPVEERIVQGGGQ